MDTRKQTPDILGELVGGAGIPESQNTSMPEKQQAVRPASRKASKPVKQQASKKPRPPKKKAQGASSRPIEKEEPATPYIKATFYISEATAEALEQAWYTLRKAAPANERGKVSKSAIVQEAVLELARELEEKGKKSFLARAFTHLSR